MKYVIYDNVTCEYLADWTENTGAISWSYNSQDVKAPVIFQSVAATKRVIESLEEAFRKNCADDLIDFQIIEFKIVATVEDKLLWLVSKLAQLRHIEIASAVLDEYNERFHTS